MKVLNIITLSLALAMVGSFIIASVAAAYLPESIAVPVSFGLSFILGYKSRSIVESIVGYTLIEASRGENGEE